MVIYHFLWVGLGSGFGGMIRYIIQTWLDPLSPLPWGTLLVNVLGSAIVGVLYGLMNPIPDSVRYFLMIGFLGGFTTFSAFSGQWLHLMNQSFVLTAWGYTFFSVFGSLLAVWGGYHLAVHFR